MSGRLLIGASGIGKTTLIEHVNHPDFRDGDDIVSNFGPGFPQTPEWWLKLSDEELKAQAVEMFISMAHHAGESWVLTGVGPLPEWIWSLPAFGIEISFIALREDLHRRNIESRIANPENKHPVDFSLIRDGYNEVLEEVIERGVDIINYQDVEDKFNSYLKARKGGSIIEARSIWTEEDNLFVGFTWNSMKVVVDVTGEKVIIGGKVGKDGIALFQELPDPDYVAVNYLQPGTTEWASAVARARKLWNSYTRPLNSRR